MSSFDIGQFISSLTVSEDEDVVEQSNDLVQLVQLITDDPWLARQGFFGLAGAMERQVEYLGNTLRPNAVDRLYRMSHTALGESDLGDVRFANEDKPHVNDEISTDDRQESQQMFIKQLDDRMRRAAVIFVKCIRAHDDISKDLEQLTYNGIKAKADQNRKAREESATKQAELAVQYAGVA